MRFSAIRYLLGSIMKVLAVLMLPPLLMAAAARETRVALSFGAAIVLALALGMLSGKRPVRTAGFYAREGFVTVGLVWVLVSFLGALPFWLSGQIPSLIDALFESVSGFTTTGASILPRVEALSRALILWRSISHYAGGMGVLVFVLAIVPMAESAGGSALYLLRAESTGPQVGKLTPKMRDSAKILYIIYVAMTVIMIAMLLIGGMPVFDSVNIAMSTAATGGFGISSDSMAAYSLYLQVVVGVFMALFGVNFTVYYLLMIRAFKKALFNEELRAYFGIMALAVALISANLIGALGFSPGPAVGHAAFQAASVMTTTGFSSIDFNLWPEFSKIVLLILMLTGACAGSTGGGIKVARVLILLKSAKNSLMRALRPRQVNRVRLGGATIEEETVHGVMGYMTMYAILAIVSFLIVSLDNFSLETHLSAVLATLNNAGPGFEMVGPTQSFACFSPLSKVVLTLNMLFGRLELIPMLLLFTPGIWKRAA